VWAREYRRLNELRVLPYEEVRLCLPGPMIGVPVVTFDAGIPGVVVDVVRESAQASQPAIANVSASSVDGISEVTST